MRGILPASLPCHQNEIPCAVFCRAPLRDVSRFACKHCMDRRTARIRRRCRGWTLNSAFLRLRPGRSASTVVDTGRLERGDRPGRLGRAPTGPGRDGRRRAACRTAPRGARATRCGASSPIPSSIRSWWRSARAHLRVDEAAYFNWVQATARDACGDCPGVRRRGELCRGRAMRTLRSADGRVTMLLVGLTATDNAGRERARASRCARRVAPLPAAPACIGSCRPASPLTGSAAADLDVNAWSAAGGDRAEKRALPLTLRILSMAFGTLVAASLPFLTGICHHDGLARTCVPPGLPDAGLEPARQRGHHDRARRSASTTRS